MIDLSIIDIFMNKDFVSSEWILEFIKVIFWRNYVINSVPKTSDGGHTMQLWNSSQTSLRWQNLHTRFCLGIFDYLPDSTGRLCAESRIFETATLVKIFYN